MDCFDLRLWPEFIAAGGCSSAPAFIDQISIDSRRINSPRALFIALQGNVDGHRFIEHAMLNGAKFAIISHHWQPPSGLNFNGIQLLAVESPLAALQSLAKVYRTNQKATVIGIAGTYGKTMVKDLLLEIMAHHRRVAASPGSFNSQIGVPLSLLTIKQSHDVALIEAAISEKNEMDTLASLIMPDAVILTPVGKKHIATLKDLETTESETLQLLKHAKVNSWVLLPKSLQRDIPGHFQTYAWDDKSDNLPHAYLLSPQTDTILTYRLDFPNGKSLHGEIKSGFYYFLNHINIAAKAAWLLGISSDAISEVIAHYYPEPIRTEIWKSQQGATFINDSYCGDPQSVDQALKLYAQCPGLRKIFMFGGLRAKKGLMVNSEETDGAICDDALALEYRRVGMALKKQDIAHLMLVGAHPFEPLIAEVQSHTPPTKISLFGSYEEAFTALRLDLVPQDCVLIKGERKIPLDLLMEAFNDSICSNQCTINLDAVKNNIARLRSHLSPKTRLMAMVKAFAYGTGELQLAKFLNRCAVDILGVSTVDEGVALKLAEVPQAIFVLNAAIFETAKVVKWGFEVGVSDKRMIEALGNEAAKQTRKLKLHLHVNTGMGRFGCRPEEALELAHTIVKSPFLELEGIMTHFAVADCAHEDDFTRQQVNTFDSVIHALSTQGIEANWRHAANSSAAMRFNFQQYNMVRVGLALYGLYTSDAASKSMELQPALTLTSRVVGINLCKAGETISYGRSYTVSQSEQRIAIIPLGYFDGLHRNYSNKGSVIIRGRRVPIVGKICMDFMMVDVTPIPSVSVGDAVLIFGEDEYGQYLPAEEFAEHGDSIVHELITCLGPRIQRLFIHEEKH